MSTDTPVLYTLEVEPPAITALSIADGRVISRIDAKWGTPDGLWVDRVTGYIYWTNMGADYNAADGTIERARLDGSQHETLVGHGAIVTPKQMAADPDRGLLYFCDREGMRIMRCALDGSALTTLLQRGGFPHDRGDLSRHCVGIALDLEARDLYWTQKGTVKGGIGRIFRMPLDAPDGTNPAQRNDVVLLMDHLPEPIDLHVAPRSGRLFWTDRGAPPDGNSLNVARYDRHGLHDHRVICRGLDEGIGLAIDAEERHAYVSDLGGTIREVDIETGACRILRKQAPTTGIYLTCI